MPSPQKLGPDDGVGDRVVVDERLDGAERLHRPQQVEPADGEGEAVGSGLDEAQRPRLARRLHRSS